MSLEERFDECMRQHELMFGFSLVPHKKATLVPMSMNRCSKCQGVGHSPSICPNKEAYTLAQVLEANEEKNEEETEESNGFILEETQEEIIKEEASEEELLALNEVLSQVQDEPCFPPLEQPFNKGSSSSPPPPHHLTHATPTQSPNTLQKFFQTISEPSPKAPNLVLSDFADLVRSMFTTPPSCILQIPKEQNKKEVSRTKRDLFSWLILFQPELD